MKDLIKNINAIRNIPVQEDVFKYKAICELIDREEAIKAVEDKLDDLHSEEIAVRILKSLPSAEKTGRWVSKDLDNFRKYEVVCSECGARYVGNYDAYDEPYDFNYCPNCGARMEE